MSRWLPFSFLSVVWLPSLLRELRGGWEGPPPPPQHPRCFRVWLLSTFLCWLRLLSKSSSLWPWFLFLGRCLVAMVIHVVPRGPLPRLKHESCCHCCAVCGCVLVWEAVSGGDVPMVVVTCHPWGGDSSVVRAPDS